MYVAVFTDLSLSRGLDMPGMTQPSAEPVAPVMPMDMPTDSAAPSVEPSATVKPSAKPKAKRRVETESRLVLKTAKVVSTKCTIENQFGDVKANARTVACALRNQLSGVNAVLGTGPGSIMGSDHPGGLAVDLMVGKNKAAGDAVVRCVTRHFDEFGVAYIIWRQAIKTSSKGAFTGMADRHSTTANHFDHVHISLRPGVTPRGLNC